MYRFNDSPSLPTTCRSSSPTKTLTRSSTKTLDFLPKNSPVHLFHLTTMPWTSKSILHTTLYSTVVYPLNLPDILYSVFFFSEEALFRYSVRTLSEMKARSGITDAPKKQRVIFNMAKQYIKYYEAQQDSIKRLKSQGGGPDVEVTFLTEIELLSRLHHCHVVPLLGYCLEYQYHTKQPEMLLVFEYMPNGNMRECLDGVSEKCLDWGARIAVAIGAARGLAYLHEAAAPRILHRDVKSTNILLDENRRAKITDLGMAKSLVSDGVPSCSSSPVRMQGAFCYFAPEYAIVGRASLMSDATPLLQDSRRVSKELPDPCLKGKFEEENTQVMTYLAKQFLLLHPDARPTMSEVVQILLTIAPEKSKRWNFSVDRFQDYTIRMERELQQLSCSISF
ncbi:unnamed protein product [Lactuca saligna]|uniref:non-specific serine/threonine protein kinase n=1 Tax=Lactuca saligna TaxID=75948 RepID=A0AA35Y9G6_LACSI|nr:unnamed protein product [Lactuca saligna]